MSIDVDSEREEETISFLVDTERSLIVADLETGGSIYDLEGWVNLYPRVTGIAGKKQKHFGHIVVLERHDNHSEMYCVDVNLGRDQFEKVVKLHAHGHMPTFSIRLENLMELGDEGTFDQLVEGLGDDGWRWLNKRHPRVPISNIDISFRLGSETDE